MKMRIKLLLLFFYLKTIGRIFMYITARKHPNNRDIQRVRFVAKIAKKDWIDNSDNIKMYEEIFEE